jgi:hypothetical protein
VGYVLGNFFTNSSGSSAMNGSIFCKKYLEFVSMYIASFVCCSFHLQTLFLNGYYIQYLRQSETTVLISVARWYIYFQTKNSNLGKVWSVLQWYRLVNFKDISCILLPFGILCMYIYGILWSFCYICSVLVCCAKKNLATLLLI